MAKTKKTAVRSTPAKKVAAKKAAKKTTAARAPRASAVLAPSAEQSPVLQNDVPRVPEDMPRKAAVVYEPQGIHPDVTSLTTNEVPLSDGVARLEDLAPGQSLEPSPAASSSNILPQPEKPSFG